MAHKVFRDAVHDMISLHRESARPSDDPVEWGDGLLLALIDTPEMQRLRRIRQLGHAARIYPSAEHSRFSHALGVMHLAKRLLVALAGRYPGLLSRQEMLAVKVSALLHDVGHGPFSHVFDHLFPACGSHEARGWLLLTREEGELAPVIRHHCQRLGLDAEGFFQHLARLLRPTPAGQTEPIGRQIISSQLDVDRMDYLLRDAHFTGAVYGRFDLEWLLHSLRVREVNGAARLCVDISRGLAALESYVAARDHMYRQVYDHKTVRAFEVTLTHLFETLAWLRQGGRLPEAVVPGEVGRFLDHVMSHGEPPLPATLFLALDDSVIEYALHHWADLPPTAGLAELSWKSRMLRDRRPLYRRLRWRLGGDVSEVIEEPGLAQAVEGFFLERAETLIALDHGSVPLRLLTRVDRLDRAPYAHLQYMAGRENPIHVVDGGNPPRAAEHASGLINFLGQCRRRQARVFVDPRALEAVTGMVRERFENVV